MNYFKYNQIPKYQSGWGVLQSLPRRIKQKVLKASNRIFGTHYGELENITKLKGQGTDVVSLDNDVIRVTPTTTQRGTLFNEFVETNSKNKTIRSAEEYKALPDDTPLSDHGFPKSNINLYAGIEDGHFKIDSLNHYNDTTTIIPVRNITEGLDPISSFYITDKSNASGQITQKEYRKARDKVFNIDHKTSRSFFDAWFSNDSKNADKLIKRLEQLLLRKITPLELNNLSIRLKFTILRTLETSRARYINKFKSANDWIRPLTELEIQRYSKYFGEKRFKQMLKNNNIDSIKSSIIDMLLITNLLYILYGRWLRNLKNFEAIQDLYALTDPKRLPGITYRIKNNADYLHALLIINDYGKLLAQAKQDGLYVITNQNDTIPVSKYNAAILDKKVVLGNPNGGLFVANFNNLSLKQLDEEVNPYLKNNPSWLFMPDMGLFSLYGLQNGQDPSMRKHTSTDINARPSYSDYWNQFTERESKAPYNPNQHYLVGVKQVGGNLNYTQYFKDGGIHIKKSHEGKFTEYCGGKVTEECIQKGKHSPSAKIRKQATFAANARKWKH